MKNPSLVCVKAALAVARRTTIGASVLIRFLRFLLLDELLAIFPYFGTGGTF